MRRSRGTHVVWLAAAAAACGGRGTSPDADGTGAGAVRAVTQGGIRVACAIERLPAGPEPAARALQLGDDVRIGFQVTDTATGAGIDGLRLGAWIAPRPGELGDREPDAETTRNIVRKLVGATYGSGATNLNTWFLATLNDDHTVALIDPTVDFSRTRLRNLVELPGAGEDLAFGDGNERLFVTMPERGEIAVVDLRTMTLLPGLATGGRPQHFARQPGTGWLWVTDDDGHTVHVVDGSSGELRRSIDVGRGAQWLAFDGATTAYAATRDGRVVAVTGAAFATSTVAELGSGVAGAVFASAAGTLWVCRDDGRLVAVTPQGQVADRAGDCVRIVDTATRTVAQTITCGREPEQIVFDSRFAFVRCAGSRNLVLIQLSALADAGGGPVLHVPVLQNEPQPRSEPARSPLLVSTPTGDAVLVAAPDEKLVYYYVEGMNAPMGSYQDYGRRPRAIAVYDRSLRAAGNGVYATTTLLEHFGNVDVYVYLDQPTQVFGRFALRVEPDAGTVERLRKSRPLALPEPEQPVTTLAVGRETDFRFALLASDTRERVAPRDDVRVLVHERFGNWQRRLPARVLADGHYAVALLLPKQGAYQVEVQCPSLNLSFGAHRPLPITASDDVEGSLRDNANCGPTETRR
jgi:YVTN family beta-propeller protein